MDSSQDAQVPDRWWRRNRWWLAALPLAVALMLVGASYRVSTFWWDNGYTHEAARAQAGRSVTVVNHFTDAVGDTSRTFTVKAAGITKVGTYADAVGNAQPVPDGSAAYTVALDFAAAPDQDLTGCLVGLLGSDGQLYGGRVFDPLTPDNVCVPADHPGPQTPIGAGATRGEVEPGQQRPTTWRVTPTVVTSSSADIVAVWVAFGWPDYVILPLPGH